MEGFEKIRLGFIGCGSHASKYLQPCLTMIDEIDFVATCDLIEEKAKRNCKRFGANTWYTDYRRMIKEQRLDAVAIVGPPQMHTELGIAILELGVNIFVEKPPSVDMEGIERLCEAADRTGRFGMVGTMWRHAEAHRMAKDIIEAEGFGRPMLFRGSFLTPGPRSTMWGLETLEWTYLLGQGVHPIDCMRFLVGDVSEAYAVVDHGENGALSFSISFEFANGATGSLTMSSFSPVLETRLFVAGEEGESVEVYNMTHLRYLKRQAWAGTGGYTDFPSLGWNPGDAYRGHGRHGYIEELEHFARSLIEGKEPHASLADAYQTIRICEAIYESYKSGHPTRL